MSQDWTKLAADLERLLKLRAIPFGMKLFDNRDDMEAIRRPLRGPCGGAAGEWTARPA
jgi:hypothetical protein